MIPHDQQFVGKADASREASKSKELTFTPEQQKVADTMKQSGEVLENKVIDAREKAGQQLKQLKGKELVDAGWKQITVGAWETFKSRLKWAIGGGVAGGVTGALGGGGVMLALDRLGETEAPGSMTAIGGVTGGTLGALGGAKFGSLVGYETAGLTYNKMIAKTDQEKVRWYDWVAGNLGVFGLRRALRGKEIGKTGRLAKVAFETVFNPIAFGGLRKVATGFWEMGKDQYAKFKAKN